MVIVPQEILREILAMVDDTPTLANCLLVSKDFQFQDEARRVLYESVALVATGQRLKRFRHAIDVNPLNAQLIKRIAFSHAWTWSQHPYHDMNNILSKLPNLRTLEIRRSDWKWEDFVDFLGPCTPCPWKLRTLIWLGRGSPIPLIAAHQGTLEHLQLSYEDRYTLEDLRAQLQELKMPNLRSLRLPHPTVKPKALGMRAEEWRAV
ncbi:hypothetical protein CCMSSC00406_0009690 [Pleurotus cornucopiae]|uniref:Uncharacterized protein n=1 Tax=Pleurotus cornucopiae TaxID=5321 RepID=A0ACB7IZ85_PLECO|nr:hypothetical protein CCMSSC00406_0009690 [Pleurotus cornucopiae]